MPVAACPQCHAELLNETTAAGHQWRCGHGHGRAWSFAVFTASVSHATMLDFLGHSQGAVEDPAIGCPRCAKAMWMITDDPRFDHVFVCRTCQLLWLDEASIRLLAIPKASPPDPSMSSEERKALALIKVGQLQQEYETKRSLAGAPDSWVGRVLTFLGLPYLEDPLSGIRSARVTVITTVLMVATTLLSLSHLEMVVQTYGFIPDDPWRSGGMTLISAFLLHAGIWHLPAGLC